ncbi:MAG: SAVED domain-containing protein [Bacillota bacterium]|nr:SAVED domain-containing protein [Bacillota bacterium]
MNRSIAARKQGDRYQSRLFWLYLLELRTSDYVETVTIEYDLVPFVDDIVVRYRWPVLDRTTGTYSSCDFIQCKYHVTQGGAFTIDALINPDFIKRKESMLQKLYKGYARLLQEVASFRLYVVSNYNWHPDDEIAKHLSEERIRYTFYAGGSSSKLGRIRAKLASHLAITEGELKPFLDTLRFKLGKNLADLTKELEPRLKLASLKPIDPTATHIIYDDLAWEWFEQGRNSFNAQTLDEALVEEKLIIKPSDDYSEISICSFPQYARRPRDIQTAHLDLTDLFEGRFARSEHYWKETIPKRLFSFFQSDVVTNLRQPIHLFFDCHLSIAFLAGIICNRKYGLQIVPAQKSTATGYDFWEEPRDSKSGLWNFRIDGDIEDEVVIAISVSNPVENHSLSFLKAKGLDFLTRIHFQPINGIGQKAVLNGEHAWHLGFDLQTILRTILPSTCQTMHLFFSCPAALAYIFGNTLRCITREIQLYEHDYEGVKMELRYYPSIKVSW